MTAPTLRFEIPAPARNPEDGPAEWSEADKRYWGLLPKYVRKPREKDA